MDNRRQRIASRMAIVALVALGILTLAGYAAAWPNLKPSVEVMQCHLAVLLAASAFLSTAIFLATPRLSLVSRFTSTSQHAALALSGMNLGWNAKFLGLRDPILGWLLAFGVGYALAWLLRKWLSESSTP